MSTVAVLVGSLRADSINRQVAEKLQEFAPEGVRVQIVEGLEAVPFYNEDLDAGAPPAAAVALREQIADADAVLAVTPEYNATIPAVLNNAIDWLSRPYGTGAIVGKPFAAIGVTPTPYGGKWAHEHARQSAKIAGATVLEHVQLSQSAIDVDPLTDPGVAERLADALAQLVAETEAAAA